MSGEVAEDAGGSQLEGGRTGARGRVAAQSSDTRHSQLGPFSVRTFGNQLLPGILQIFSVICCGVETLRNI